MEISKKIAWSKRALKQFENIYRYIFENSEQNAEKVRKEILDEIAKASKYPESYSPEMYKTNNDGSYRYFEKHRLRVTYRVMEDSIRIVRVRHSSMRPKLI